MHTYIIISQTEKANTVVVSHVEFWKVELMKQSRGVVTRGQEWGKWGDVG